LKQIPFNAGHSETEGLDWNFDFRRQTSIGNLTVDLSGTHMIKQRFQLLEGGPWYTDLGVFGPDNNVVFRNTMRLVLSLQTGAFTNTLSMSYKSGYQDESYTADSATVRLQNPDGTPGAPVDFAGLDVSSYKLFDWQTRYQLNKSWRFTLGINNIFNTAPPFSLKTVAGNQVGYDSRYADPTGRAFTAGALFRF
jgi:iron complex outermembrane receptor protein